MRACRVSEQSRKFFRKSSRAEPVIQPESCGGAITNRNRGVGTKSRESSRDASPNRGVEVVGIAQIILIRPAILALKPNDPGGVGIRVKF